MLTSPHQTPHPFFQQPDPMASMHKNMERLVRQSGLASTFVRPGLFAANALGWWAARIREHDDIRWPYGDAATAPIDERDIAAVAVRALFDEAASGAEYMITGPHSLTQREQVIAIGDVIGRTLRFEEITPDDARRELGFPRAAMDMLLDAWAAAAGSPAYVTTIVAEVTGTPARTFAEWVRSNKQAFVRARGATLKSRVARILIARRNEAVFAVFVKAGAVPLFSWWVLVAFAGVASLKLRG